MGTRNMAAELRLARASAVAQIYASHDTVAAIIVGGSVARSWADQWSDVELGIFWTELPTEQTLETLADRAGGVRRRVFPGQPRVEVMDEEWYADGLKIDIYHRTIAAIEQVIGDVIHCTNPTWENQTQVATIRSGIVLHGLALVDSWRQRTVYPEGLAQSMVVQHLVFGPHAWLEMLAERDDTLYLYSLCCEVERRMLGALLGINRMYPPAPGTKWLVRVAEELPVAPRELANRLRLVFRSEPRDGIRELGRLVDETIGLVEKHVPEVETTAVRDRIAQRRLPWPSSIHDERC